MSLICGVYSPRNPALATPETLARMLDTMADGRSRRRTCHQSDAGLALGYVYLAAFLGPGDDSDEGWYEDDSLVVAVDGTALEEVPQTKLGLRSPGSAGLIAERFLARPAGGFPVDLKGTFSGVIWDAGARRLSLVADRIASRTFYYYWDESQGLLVFATQLKAIYAHPAVKVEVDLKSLPVYLACTYLPGTLTMIKGARKLGSAEIVQLDSSASLQSSIYWQAAAGLKDEQRSVEEWVPLIQEAMARTLAETTNRTPRLGIFQSGGRDSSLLMAALKQAGHSEVESICFGFLGPRSHDLEWAAKAAADLSVRHHTVQVGPADISLELFADLMRPFDEPGNSFSIVTDYFLLKTAASLGLDSCLAGDQGEAIFDGTFNWDRIIDRRQQGHTDSDEFIIAEMFKRSKFIDAGDQAKLFSPAVAQEVDYDRSIESYLAHYRRIAPKNDIFDTVNAMLCLRTPPKIIGKRLLAGSLGVETRFPFVNADLLAFSWTIPGRFRGENTSNYDRFLLSAAYQDMMPSLQARTNASGMPGFPWIVSGYERFEAIILAVVARLKTSGLFQPAAIDKMIAKYRTRNRRLSVLMKLNLLFGLQVWLEYYVYRTDPFAEFA